jgi:uridine kinase
MVTIGVAGGSGSGKTTVVRELVQRLGSAQVTVIHHDSYYRSAAGIPPEERVRINYDHPDALETELLVHHIEELRASRAIEVPVYDYALHDRTDRTVRVEPTKVVIIDGLLVLWDAALRALLDIKVYVDTDSDLRFIRRLERDVRERGRALEGIVEQYLATVRPMHLEFVEPSKRYADLIVPEGGHNRVAIQILAAQVRGLVAS